MNIRQGTESNIIGVGDNYIVLENVQTYADITYTIKGVTNTTFNICPVASNGVIELNLREITRLVYDNLENYSDPFDYTADKLYTETDGYHFVKLDIVAVDANNDTVSILDLQVINAALDVGECLILTSLVDKELNDDSGKEAQPDGDLNADLTYNLH